MTVALDHLSSMLPNTDRVLVCGGRDFTDRARVFLTLDVLHRASPISLVIHGGARGADSLAGEWAEKRGIDCKVFRADWGKHGRAAGPIRNQQMMDEGRPTLVVAYPGGRGTADMVSRAQKANVDWMRFAANAGEQA